MHPPCHHGVPPASMTYGLDRLCATYDLICGACGRPGQQRSASGVYVPPGVDVCSGVLHANPHKGMDDQSMKKTAPTVLITGGAKRIGAVLARRFALEGFSVVVHHNTSTADAEALQSELNENRPCCWLAQGDISSEHGVNDVFAQARAAVGPLDLCINNASLFVNDEISDLSESIFYSHLDVNLKASVYLAKLMNDQDEFAQDRLVINMLDNKLYAVNPDFLTYTLSKSALLTATHMLAMQFDGFPRVCGIAPCITLISGEQTQQDFDRTSRINPLRRRVFPTDLAEAALFIWRTKSFNNQVIRVDAGQTLLKLPRDVAFIEEQEVLR